MNRAFHSLAAFLLAFAALGPAAAQDAQLGRIDFPVTGSAGCQRHFTAGMLAMHSFQYDQAHASFQAALADDPLCAMAAWGDAMAYEHPLWGARDLPKSRAALARITREDHLGPRERAFIATARTLFAVEEPQAALRAWLAATAAMHRDNPADVEAALQHVLAIMAVHEDDTRELVKAGAIALDIHARLPDHPGAAHYIIHAFDTNDLAPLALPAARRYARIAPGSAHALHMPSHTFLQLGMWHDAVPSNERAFAVSKQLAAQLGQGPDKWDWHAFTWLVAAHLELGQARRAGELLAGVRDVLARHPVGYQRDAYADAFMAYVVQTRRWEEAEALAAPLLAPVAAAPAAGSGGHGAHTAAPDERSLTRIRISTLRLLAEAAARRGDMAAAEARVKEVRDLLAKGNPYGSPRAPSVVRGHLAEIEALATAARAPTEENRRAVLAAMEASAKLTDDVPVSGPAFFLPARERLGDALLAHGRAAEALAEYEKVLKTRPNRALSLQGAVRAARAANLAQRAEEHSAALAALWKDADAGWRVAQDARRP